MAARSPQINICCLISPNKSPSRTSAPLPNLSRPVIKQRCTLPRSTIYPHCAASSLPVAPWHQRAFDTCIKKSRPMFTWHQFQVAQTSCPALPLATPPCPYGLANCNVWVSGWQSMLSIRLANPLGRTRATWSAPGHSLRCLSDSGTTPTTSGIKPRILNVSQMSGVMEILSKSPTITA